MAQNITWLGNSYSDVGFVDFPKTGGGLATFFDVGGSQQISQNGTYDVSALAEVVVDVTGGGTPAISVVDTPDSHGGTIRTITGLDISDSTLTTADQLSQGVTAYNKLGVLLTGTGSGGGLTQHEIHLEFTDSTDTDIEVDYDDALIATMITAYEPVTYGGKTVTLAQLDGVTWYEPVPIPIGTQLIDFAAVVSGYIIDADGSEVASQWSCCSDFTAIDPSMTFSYIGYQWYFIAFYNSQKTFISGFDMYQDPTATIMNDYAHGTLSPSNIPSTAAYVRISSYPNNASSSELSLIRTA